MKNLFSTLMVITSLLSTATAFAINHSSKQATLYRSLTDQAWPSGGSGVTAPIQTDANYIVLPTAGWSCAVANIGCTYTHVASVYRFEEKGDNSLN